MQVYSVTCFPCLRSSKHRLMSIRRAILTDILIKLNYTPPPCRPAGNCQHCGVCAGTPLVRAECAAACRVESSNRPNQRQRVGTHVHCAPQPADSLPTRRAISVPTLALARRVHNRLQFYPMQGFPVASVPGHTVHSPPPPPPPPPPRGA